MTTHRDPDLAVASSRGRAVSFAAEPLAVAAPLAAELVGISERMWRSLDSRAQVPPPIRLGSRRLWGLDELRRWIAAGAPPRERWAMRQERDGQR